VNKYDEIQSEINNIIESANKSYPHGFTKFQAGQIQAYKQCIDIIKNLELNIRNLKYRINYLETNWDSSMIKNLSLETEITSLKKKLKEYSKYDVYDTNIDKLMSMVNIAFEEMGGML
jgi:hypothetical protein